MHTSTTELVLVIARWTPLKEGVQLSSYCIFFIRYASRSITCKGSMLSKVFTFSFIFFFPLARLLTIWSKYTSGSIALFHYVILYFKVFPMYNSLQSAPYFCRLFRSLTSLLPFEQYNYFLHIRNSLPRRALVCLLHMNFRMFITRYILNMTSHQTFCRLPPTNSANRISLCMLPLCTQQNTILISCF